jgi:hypothetical protein
METVIGKMHWNACKKCVNQAGPKGCNCGSIFQDIIEIDEEDNVICECYCKKEITVV